MSAALMLALSAPRASAADRTAERSVYSASPRSACSMTAGWEAEYTVQSSDTGSGS